MFGPPKCLLPMAYAYVGSHAVHSTLRDHIEVLVKAGALAGNPCLLADVQVWHQDVPARWVPLHYLCGRGECIIYILYVWFISTTAVNGIR